MEREGLQREHWRKSSQWIALNRKHAYLAVADVKISQLFKEYVFFRLKPLVSSLMLGAIPEVVQRQGADEQRAIGSSQPRLCC